MSTKGQQLKKVLAITLLTAAITIEGNQWANAQFNNAYPFSGFNCAQTNVIGPVTNWIRSVGVGNFSGNGAFTNSFLHVNSNYLMLPTNGSITSLGEVFRTDAPSGFNTQWRLLRGGAEMGRIFSFSTDNNFHINSSSGDLLFHASITGLGAPARAIMRIYQPTRFVGIGPVDVFTARSELHIHDTTTTYLQFTNTTTQSAPNDPQLTDGFIVGINGTTAELRQQENADMNFFTNDGINTLERFRITNNDRILAFRNTSSSIVNPPSVAKFQIDDRNLGFNNDETLLLFRVRGRGTTVNTEDPVGGGNIYTLAEITQSRTNSADAGLRIQGSRTLCTACDVSFIDLADYDSDDSNPFFTMARIAAGMGDVSGNKGYLKFYTNEGSGTGLMERMRIISDGRVGVNTVSPVNRFEISSGVAATTLNPANATSPTRSGLRFTDLDATLAVDATGNSSNTVLSVNDDGDAILVEDQKGDAADADWYDVSTDAPSTDIYNNIYTYGNVLIGTNQSSNVRMNIVNSSEGGSFLAQNYAANGSYGISGEILNTTSSSGKGVIGRSASPNSSQNIGVQSYGQDGTAFNKGIEAHATGTGADNYGIQSYVSGGNNNYGFSTIINSTGNNYGVYCDVSFSSGSSNFGIYGKAAINNWAGFFQGDLNVNGSSYTSSGDWSGSDSIFKENISDISNALFTIKRLQPHKFNFKTSEFPYLNFSSGDQYGLVSQEVKQIIPEIVKSVSQAEQRDSANNIISPQITYEALNYTGLIPITIQAVKELDSAVSPLTTPPSAPTLVSPANGNTGDFCSPRSITGGRLTWNSVPGNFVFYEVQVSKDSGFINNVVIYTASMISREDTFVTISVCDTAVYYWRVKASNIAASGPWSEVRNFVNTGIMPPIGPGGTSDSALKLNVVPLTNSLQKVNQLTGVSFIWDTQNHPSMQLPSGNQIGLVAQQVQPVYPEVVYLGDSGYYSVDYQRLVPPLVEAIKELSARVTAQDSLIQSMQAQLTQCCTQPSLRQSGDNGNNSQEGRNIGSSSSNGEGKPADNLSVELSSPLGGDLKGAVILYPNIPNPFSGTTIIKYFVPAGVKGEVVMLFSEEKGNTLKTVELTERGTGTVEVQPKELAAGIYTYSIAVDGKIVGMRKMVYQR